MAGEGHEGWTNYETWCVNLHLTNNEPSYLKCMAMTRSWVANQPSIRLGEALKGLVEGPLEDMDFSRQLNADQVALHNDLLRSALAEVDWDEIADGFVELVKDEQKRREQHAKRSRS